MSHPARARYGDGWLLFAAVVLIIAGVVRILDGFWAFDKDDEIRSLQALLFDDDLAAYGWLWIIVGILLIVAGFGILSRSQWARWFGIVVAALATISSMQWIYEFPIWSMISTLMAILVLYALTTYGGPDTTETPGR